MAEEHYGTEYGDNEGVFEEAPDAASDEVVLEHVQRGDEEFLEHYHLRAYQRRQKEEAAKRDKQREHAAATTQVEQGLLEHKPPVVHSERVVQINLKPNADFELDKDLRNQLKKKQLTPKKLRDMAVEHEHLRKLHMEALRQGRPLAPSQQQKFQKLNETLTKFGYIVNPSTNQSRIPELPEETENRVLKEHLEERFPTKITGLKPKIKDDKGKDTEDNESIESTIAEHGQEAKQSLPEGWASTYQFNKEQLNRKYHALRTGEASIGFGERGVPGHAMGVPTEKAKVTIGPNQEVAIRTNDWVMLPPGEMSRGQRDTAAHIIEYSLKNNHTSTTSQIQLANTLAKLKEAPPLQDKFEARLERKPEREQGFDEEGNYKVEGQKLAKTLSDAGIDIHTRREGDRYIFYTDEGKHLNPDQVNALKKALQTHQGIKDFKVVRQQQWVRRKHTVPVGYSRLPKDLNERDIVPGTGRKNIYSGRIGARFGERDPVSKELLPGEVNRVGVRVGPRAVQYNLGESTDAIGWGKSWRPGEKEISSAVMAIPEARRKRELREAYEASFNDNDEKINAYLAKYHPYDEAGGEQEERKKSAKKEAAELSSAAFGAGYYTVKRKLPTRIANFTFAHATKIPKVGPQLEKFRGPSGTLFRDIDLGIRRPLSAKVEMAKTRAQHPLSAIRHNPTTGEPEIDPTVPGITNEGHLNVPSVRYRSRAIGDEDYKLRDFERRVERIKSNVAARQHVQDILRGDAPSNKAKSWLASKQGKSMLWDVYNISNEGLKGQVENLQRELTSYLPKEEQDLTDVKFQIKNKGYSLAETPKLHEYLKTAKTDIDSLLNLPEHYYSREALDTDVRAYAAEHPNLLPKVMGTVGKATIIGGAALGGTALAVDRYQQYKVNKGHDINHPVANALIPERIAVPKVSVQRTLQYTVPHNALTDALDLEGEKMPIAGRISVHNEEKLRLREHKDISGEGYKKNLPLLGGLGVRSPAAGGSLAKSTFSPTAESGLGPVKNMYVAGKKVPVDITMGRKERWDNKRHKLRASNDPFGVSAKDRERLAALASESPEAEEHIRAFYAGNQRVEDLLDSKDERQRAVNKNMYWLRGNKDLMDLDDVKGRKGVAVSGQTSRTLEEQQEASRADRRAREDYKRSVES